MKENCPSATALRAAMRRAAHQIADDPRVFDDPLALSILGEENLSALHSGPKWFERTPIQIRLRAFLAARSRCAEDELHHAVRRGVSQYVVLGAGLDTFAYRNPYPDDVLHVFEVDHPATQNWKHSLLEEAGIGIPRTLTFSPVELETQTLEEGLRRAGFDPGRGSLFSWLGVASYLTESAVAATLQFVASMPVGSGIVFDYQISPSLLEPTARLVFDRLAHRVALAGEPFQTFFDPSLLENSLRVMGFGEVEDMGPGELNARYFQGRTDQLRVGSLAHIMIARV
ncbi:MAG TPA: SAM-dependent methyltransferase [Syntrophobacteraceae bacterium]|nr:SAM-dependent methyltransferase [Syntrophobacteraceae bacterium]